MYYLVILDGDKRIEARYFLFETQLSFYVPPSREIELMGVTAGRSEAMGADTQHPRAYDKLGPAFCCPQLKARPMVTG